MVPAPMPPKKSAHIFVRFQANRHFSALPHQSVANKGPAMAKSFGSLKKVDLAKAPNTYRYQGSSCPLSQNSGIGLASHGMLLGLTETYRCP